MAEPASPGVDDQDRVPWRYLPNDFPPWRTVYGYFARWRDDGTVQLLHDG